MISFGNGSFSGPRGMKASPVLSVEPEPGPWMLQDPCRKEKPSYLFLISGIIIFISMKSHRAPLQLRLPLSPGDCVREQPRESVQEFGELGYDLKALGFDELADDPAHKLSLERGTTQASVWKSFGSRLIAFGSPADEVI
jgi:hypothetical protein